MKLPLLSLLPIIPLASLTCLGAEELALDIGISKMGTPIPYSKIKTTDLGEKIIKPIDEGIRKISQVPEPGIHPRLLQSPEDKVPMRKLYKSTPSGKLMWQMLLGFTDKLKGKIIDRKDYPTHPDGSQLATYMRGGWTTVADNYKLVKANQIDKIGKNEKEREAAIQDVLGSIVLEAYRCWIEDDGQGGKELSTPIENIVDYYSATAKVGMPTSACGGFNMAFTYDYAYNYLSENQRDKIRKLIAKISINKAHYGSYIEPDATTSNWMPLDNYIALPILAIEGEEGFNQHYYDGYKRAYQNFLSYGWYKSGCPYEGIGKNNQFVATMQILSRRGLNIHSHPHVRAFGNKFLPGVALPNANGFIGMDDWGGTGRNSIYGGYKMNIDDIIGLKWMYPKDKAVDYAWGVYMGQLYERFNDFRVSGYFHSALIAVMFPSDLMNKKLDAEKAGIPLTFFCPERGYMVTKSDSSKNALMLAMHTRQDKGGHTAADRNSIIFAADGRLWGYQATQAGTSRLGTSNESRNYSVITIDDVGECGPATGCLATPGKVIDFQNKKGYSSMTGDAKYAYDWQISAGNWSGQRGTMGGPPNTDCSLLSQGWTKVMETPNDFQYEKQPYAYMDKPFYEQNHWLCPYHVQQYCKRPWNPVKKAFRSATLVRGKRPFALIVDDIQAEDQKHHLYKWNMQMSIDVELYKHITPEGGSYRGLILCGHDVVRDTKNKLKPQRGDRMLYVIILGKGENEKADFGGEYPRIEDFMIDARWAQGSGKRLVIPSYSTSPDYKIILYPFLFGETLPSVSMKADETQVMLKWSNQNTKITFKPDGTGRTQVDIQNQ